MPGSAAVSKCHIVITSHKEVIFSLVFVCYDYGKFGGKVANGSRKKRLDIGGNSDHVTLGLES